MYKPKQHTVFGGGMVTSGQQNKATHTHKTKSENDAYTFLIQPFESLIFIPCFR